MVGRIADVCAGAGPPGPPPPAETVAHRRRAWPRPSPQAVERGPAVRTRVDVRPHRRGGSQNALLCQLTADRAGQPVLAGPVEATALGNVLVQARQHGLVSGTLEDLRALVARTHDPVRY